MNNRGPLVNQNLPQVARFRGRRWELGFPIPQEVGGIPVLGQARLKEDWNRGVAQINKEKDNHGLANIRYVMGGKKTACSPSKQ